MKLPNLKDKKTKIIIGLILAVSIPTIFYSIGYSDGKKKNIVAESKYEEVDVNGLTVSEACEKVREKGWKVASVIGLNNNYTVDESDCSDTENKVLRYSYSEEDVLLYFASDKQREEQSDNEQSNNTEQQPTESTITQADSQESYTMTEDKSIYDIKELCERYAESKGYPNAEIETSSMQGTDMENGKYYKVSGTLYIDEGITSSERSVGEYACTADYIDWVVTAATLNRENI